MIKKCTIDLYMSVKVPTISCRHLKYFNKITAAKNEISRRKHGDYTLFSKFMKQWGTRFARYIVNKQ